MALILADRVQETTTTTGTTDFALGGAVTGFQTFSSAIGNGNTCYYAALLPNTSEWEVGLGTVGGGGAELVRTAVYASSTGSKVSFSAGQKFVFVTYPAEKSVNLDAGGNVSALGTISSGVWNGTAITDAYLATISTAGKVSNSATTATNTDTANAIVARDASGNFSAGTITAALSGNASTATTATNQSGGTVAATTGSFSGQVTSTLASGTSPFSITSTTLNTNLNADLLDGQHGSYYQPASTAITTSNIGSQSVNYATSAGSATTATSATSATTATTATNVSGTVAVANGGTGATDAATARTNLDAAVMKGTASAYGGAKFSLSGSTLTITTT